MWAGAAHQTHASSHIGGHARRPLHKGRDIFAWQPSKMRGILREATEHSLQIGFGSKARETNDYDVSTNTNELPSDKRLANSLRSPTEAFGQHNDVLEEERKMRNIRTYVDHAGLDKACLEDLFPLSRVNQQAGSTSSCEVLSLMMKKRKDAS